MLFVSALYGICSVGGKALVLNSSPMFTGVVLFGLYGPLLTIILVGVGKAKMRNILKRPLLGLGVGAVIALEVVIHHIAISLTSAAYMITIKRMAALFSVVYGWLLFNEDNIRFRFIGSTVMVAGAAVIVLFGQ